jgi:predicted transcriptional regulator
VLRIEPDDLVTMSDIAERLGRTRESVRLLVAGERGPGDFPPPLSHLRTRNRLWRWSEVAAWAGVTDGIAQAHAQTIAALNAALELRAMAVHLAPDARTLVASLERSA